MRTSALVVFGATSLSLGLVACDDSGSATGPAVTSLAEPPPVSSTSRAPKMVPYRAEATFGPGSTAIRLCEAPPGYTGPPAALPALLIAQGRHTHLGRATSRITIERCELTATGILGGGHFTHTAPNGDGFSGAWDALFTPPTFTFVTAGKEYPLVAESGTGRFVGISGHASGAGTIDPATGEGTFSVHGRISSVGSSR